MKLGLSNLLGELIEAEKLNYEDCRNFQVVCPSCREPVFKAVRPEESKEVHYLSHYAQVESYVSDCELRVARISSEEVTRRNSMSREQKLKYFLSVIQEAVPIGIYTDNEKAAKAREHFVRKLKKCRSIQKFRDGVHHTLRTKFAKMRDPQLMEMVTGFVEFTMEKEGGFYKTAFALDTQKRIALDIWRHVMTQQAKPTFDFLFVHAYLLVVTNLNVDESRRKLSKAESDMRNIMANILNMGKEEGSVLLETLVHYKLNPPDATIPGYSMYQKLGSDILHEMIGILIRLPYFELLKNAQKGSATR